VAAAGVLIAALYAVKEYLGPSGVIQLVILSFMTLAAYGLMLIAVKEITRDDLRFVRETLSPKNIYGDLMDEMRKS
jgi:hypothetical protein